MTVSRESGRGLAAVSRERVPWKAPLQDTTRLYADLAFPDPENVGNASEKRSYLFWAIDLSETGALARGRPLTVYT